MGEFFGILTKALEAARIDPATSTLRGNILTSSDGTTYFARTSQDIKQIAGEVESLRALAVSCPEVVPEVYAFEVEGGEAAMISQYFDLKGGSTNGDTQKELARRVAKPHTQPQDTSSGTGGKYGFHFPTHCGVTEQDNTWEEEWEDFFRNRRLGNLVKRIGNSEISQEWERLKEKAIPSLLRNIVAPPVPVILHGDLWSGNTGVDGKTGQPVIFDPSSYYGHNEADLGIMRMFGGFNSDFFEEYHSIHPRSEPYYEERQKLYELYHHLNHALMFGGGYMRSASDIMKKLINWADTQDCPAR